jgi:hypothetical protein
LEVDRWLEERIVLECEGEGEMKPNKKGRAWWVARARLILNANGMVGATTFTC